MKDTLVVTASGSGAEVIPILKGAVVFPLSILSVIGFSKLSNHVRPSKIFYSIILFFMAVVCFYGYYLYPHMEQFVPTRSADWLSTHLGPNFSHWVAVYRHWIHAVFFVTAELWAQIVIILLFWGFANRICRVDEAKRMYTLCIAAGDLATITAGPLVLHYLKVFGPQNYGATLQTLIGYVLFCGFLMLGVFWWINRYGLSDTQNSSDLSQDKKTKLTLLQSLKHIASSKYLIWIAILVFGCALSINMVEVTWKANLRKLYPSAVAYQAYVAKTTFYVGIVGLVTVFFLGGNLLRRFGWHFSAQIAPIVIGCSGVLFFFLSYFQKYLGSFWGLTPLAFVVFFGAFQNILSKVVKYSFFDSTKEIAYIPLDRESKTKGKAAIDVVGSRLGKSSSSWIQVLLMGLAGTNSVLIITPYLMPLLLGMTIYWSYAVRGIHTELEKKTMAPS